MPLTAIADFAEKGKTDPVDVYKRQVEVDAKPDSGDEAVNAQIAEGRAALHNLREADKAIEDEAVSARLKRMTDAGGKIFDILEKEPSRAGEVRRFMNYYLPRCV